MSGPLRESCHHANEKQQNCNFLNVVHGFSPLDFFVTARLGLRLHCYYWTKVLYILTDKSVYPRGQRLKSKIYEITKPQTTSSRDRPRRCRIALVGLDRSIGTAGRIPGNDHNNLGHGTGSQASE